MEYKDYPDSLSDDTVSFDPVPAAGEPVTDSGYHSAYTEPSSDASGLYRNTGAGRRESPFADSPYESAFHSRADEAVEKAHRTPKQKKNPTGLGKRVAAAAAALALVIASCAVTAGIVNRRWEERTEQLEQS